MSSGFDLDVESFALSESCGIWNCCTFGLLFHSGLLLVCCCDDNFGVKGWSSLSFASTENLSRDMMLIGDTAAAFSLFLVVCSFVVYNPVGLLSPKVLSILTADTADLY